MKIWKIVMVHSLHDSFLWSGKILLELLLKDPDSNTAYCHMKDASICYPIRACCLYVFTPVERLDISPPTPVLSNPIEAVVRWVI